MGLENILSLFSQEFFYSTIRMAAPIIMAAIGETIMERAGILNLGIESMMMFGAFFGVVGSATFGNPWMGMLTGVFAGAVAGALFGFIVITLRANQSVTGTAFNIIGYGLTTFLARVLWGIRVEPLKVAQFQDFSIPVLSDIPFVGYILFDHDPTVYFAYVVVILSTIFLFRTIWGLRIRAVGEHPRAAETIGINVFRYRYLAAIAAGALAALGGSMLSLAQLDMFVDRMSGGRGFFALAAVILGRWNPVGVALGCLLFGAGNAIQMRIQAFGLKIAPDLLISLPFVLTLLVVIIFRSTATPKALAKPYEKEATLE